MYLRLILGVGALLLTGAGAWKAKKVYDKRKTFSEFKNTSRAMNDTDTISVGGGFKNPQQKSTVSREEMDELIAHLSTTEEVFKQTASDYELFQIHAIQLFYSMTDEQWAVIMSVYSDINPIMKFNEFRAQAGRLPPTRPLYTLSRKDPDRHLLKPVLVFMLGVVTIANQCLPTHRASIAQLKRLIKLVTDIQEYMHIKRLTDDQLFGSDPRFRAVFYACVSFVERNRAHADM